MAVIQVTSREFRDNQAALFGLADKGERVIIRRRNKPSYILTTINDDDFFLSAEAEARLELSRKQYLTGETIVCKTAEEAVKYLESL
jgi:antitoxin (DNA-binding transcriptional repressor) of toxin-antitoxin stability system